MTLNLPTVRSHSILSQAGAAAGESSRHDHIDLAVGQSTFARLRPGVAPPLKIALREIIEETYPLGLGG
jgi:hypothetical protein